MLGGTVIGATLMDIDKAEDMVKKRAVVIESPQSQITEKH